MKRNIINWILKYKHTLLFIFLLCASFLTIFISKPFYRKQISGFGIYVSSLFQRGVKETELSIETVAPYLMTKKELVQQNKALEEKLQELEKELASRPNVDYYARLNKKMQAEMVKANPFYPVATYIMARQLNPTGDSFIISAGTLNGVKKNDVVVAVQDKKVILVGRILTTTPYSSTFWPIYHTLSAVGARLVSGRYEGILKGAGSSSKDLQLTRIDKEAEATISYGDSVITSGLNSIYPPGIQIGTVNQMEKDIEGPSLKISIKPSINFKILETLYVLTTAQEREE